MTTDLPAPLCPNDTQFNVAPDFSGTIDRPGFGKFHFKDGQLHSTIGPAVEYANGKEEYRVKGVYCSPEAFTETFLLPRKSSHEITENERKSFTGVIVYPSGVSQWFSNGKLHRVYGPAILNPENKEFGEHWYQHGKLHCEDGPAIFDPSSTLGSKQYWLNGIFYLSEEDFKRALEAKKTEINILTLRDTWENVPKDYTGIVHYSASHATFWFYKGLLHRDNDLPAKVFQNGDKEWYKFGMRHRDKGPACVSRTSEKWYFYDQLHKEDGPAEKYTSGYIQYHLHGEKFFTQDEFNRVLNLEKNMTQITANYHGQIPLAFTGVVEMPKEKVWYSKGQIHREMGPAREHVDGKMEWRHKGKLHRAGNLPAIIFPNGDKEYFLHGSFHRTDGPARIAIDGTEEYYFHGKKYTKKEFEYYQKRKLIPRNISSFGEFTVDFTGCLSILGNFTFWFENGFLHREEGPAVMTYFFEEWYQNGKLHREDGPASVDHRTKKSEYWIEGKQLTDLEFEEYSKSTTKFYFLRSIKNAPKENIELCNSEYHTTDNYTGTVKSERLVRSFYKGYLHSSEGPALVWADSGKDYYFFGNKLSEKEFNILFANRIQVKTTFDIPDNFTGIAINTFQESTSWYKNGKLHNEDGPAIVNRYHTGNSWYLNGVFHSEIYFHEKKMLTEEKHLEQCNLVAEKVITKFTQEEWFKGIDLCWDKQRFQYFLRVTIKESAYKLKPPPKEYEKIKFMYITANE